jgi:hypothetical protein
MLFSIAASIHVILCSGATTNVIQYSRACIRLYSVLVSVLPLRIVNCLYIVSIFVYICVCIMLRKQMGRLCALLDPSVHVIYVSPCPLRDEMLDYQVKLVV